MMKSLSTFIGSRWDRVLIRALYFGEQLHNFEQAIQGFALDSSAAAAIGYGHAQLLLEVSQFSCRFAYECMMYLLVLSLMTTS